MQKLKLTHFEEFLYDIGQISVFMYHILKSIFTLPLKLKHLFEQMNIIGVNSIPIVFITASFTGMVLALQSIYQLKKFGAEIYVGGIVAISMARELSPVLTSLIIAGRVGSSIAAELGTMKVTEQIDALITLGADPINYLVKPKVIAFLIMLPGLVAFADFVGYMGGYIVSVYALNVNKGIYLNMTTKIVESYDIIVGIIKAFFFAFLIATISSFIGLHTEGGAEGVGRSTTRAVVVSSIAILVADYLLTALFFT